MNENKLSPKETEMIVDSFEQFAYLNYTETKVRKKHVVFDELNDDQFEIIDPVSLENLISILVQRIAEYNFEIGRLSIIDQFKSLLRIN